MVAYKFYRWDEKGDKHFVGILPERRRERGRITQQSIINWWKKAAGYGPMQEAPLFDFEQVNIWRANVRR